jgi:hypothetical protein
MTRNHVFAAAGAVGAVYLAATLALMHLIQPELDPITRFVSEYAHGRLGWLITIGYTVAGAGTLALAWSLRGILPGRRGLSSAAFAALFGVTIIATGLTRIDVAVAQGVVVSTVSGQVHELAGYVAILGLFPAAFLIAGAFRRDPALAGAALAARQFAVGLVVAFVLAVFSQGLELLGVGQRLFLGTWLAWLVFVGVQLSTRGGGRKPRVAGAR